MPSFVHTDFSAGSTFDDVEADKLGVGIETLAVFVDRFDQTAMAAATDRQFLGRLISSGLYVPLSLLGTDIPAVVIKTITGTTYTLIASDVGKELVFTSGSPITLTVPSNASVPVAVGSVVGLKTRGAGQLTVTSSVGGAVKSRGSAFKLAGTGSPATLKNYAADDWDLEGDLTT